MYIKEIELRNFRIYKGVNNISLIPDKEKNLIVISGKNGFGKTTFLMSLVWCLYGRQMEKVDDLYKKEIWDKGGYGKFIGNSLNHIARENGESTFSVAVTFTEVKIPDITCNEVKVIRSYNTETGTAENLKILIDGHPNQITDDLSTQNQDGGEIFVREFILPIEIAKFFFFDAEKIVSLAEVNGKEQRKALGTAYSEVLGIHKYEALRTQLENLQDEYRKESAKPKDRKDFVDIEAALEKIEIDIENVEKEIDDATQLKVEKKAEADKIQRTLIKEGNHMSLEEVEELKEQESKLDTVIQDLRIQLKDYYEIIPFGLAGDTLFNMAIQLENERIIKESENSQSNAKEKTRLFLNELETLRSQTDIIVDVGVRRFYEEHIEKLIGKHFFGDSASIPDDFTILHDFSSVQVNELDQLIDTLRYSFKEEFRKISNGYQNARSEIASIQRKLRKAEKDADDAYISGLKEQKKKLDGIISGAESEIDVLNQKLGGLNNDKKIARQRQAELRKKIEVSQKNQAANQIIENEVKTLKKFIARFKERKKESLEVRIKEGLNLLMHKNDFISRVEVDISLSGEDIEISLYTKIGSKEVKIDKGSLSMGERQMYSSALLSALVEESNIDFPVFIDSPMQKFDREHAQNIIKHFYPKVSKQVILFPLIHKELTSEEYDLLIKNVSNTYIIKNTPSIGSEFLEVEPKKLISKYNELYVASN
ncbi:DNA sulfur modification protein DndD [Flagellimonas profundi]|uniref:DNA sulfur modification protein DndD n=1 Tax=Flagellimonas profundi TaxID=2915620 RepID=A0ABS3FAH8_9FLAO|nr:DNA sulfur modification protein DndD [Allomuricauda profundi]MBO0340159.1 DNA sulfur modification protein DndD [Allomuricauda profundi]